jgi:hypothetical protein
MWTEKTTKTQPVDEEHVFEVGEFGDGVHVRIWRSENSRNQFVGSGHIGSPVFLWGDAIVDPDQAKLAAMQKFREHAAKQLEVLDTAIASMESAALALAKGTSK